MSLSEEIRLYLAERLEAPAYYNLAPDGAALPYTVFSRPSSVILPKFNSGDFENQLWLIKALAIDTESQSAAEKCDEMLDVFRSRVDNDATALSGSVIYCRANQVMPDFTELIGGQMVLHRGLYFDIRIERN